MRPLPEIIDHILSTPAMVPYTYWESAPEAEDGCFHLLRYCFREGFGVDIHAQQHEAAQQVSEVWWHTDPTPLADILAPWQVLVFHIQQPHADHLGLVIDQATFLHIRRRIGVRVEPIRRWETRLLQIVQLNQEWLRAA
jgi:hypothetical protein